MSDTGKDVLGQPLTETEARLLAAYRDLGALLEADLAPAARASVAEAVAALWQAVNDLALTDDRPGA
jgi:hypothetical protein